jgi:hypothetical protein
VHLVLLLTNGTSFPELQQEQPQFYSNLAGHLSAEEQALIQDIIVKAEEVAQAQAQAQQSEMVSPHGTASG